MRHDRALWKTLEGKYVWLLCEKKEQHWERINRKEKGKVHQTLGSWSIRIKRRNNFPISVNKEDITHELIFIKMIRKCCQFSSVQSLSHVRFFGTPWTVAHQASLPSPTPRVYSNSCPSSQWCHPTISPSVVSFSTHLQSFPASGSFAVSQLFASGDQSIGVSAAVSVPPMNIQCWFPLGWISLQSKGLSRAFSNTAVKKHHVKYHVWNEMPVQVRCTILDAWS